MHICNSLNSSHIFSVIVNIHAIHDIYITRVVVYLLAHFTTRSTLRRKYIFITWYTLYLQSHPFNFSFIFSSHLSQFQRSYLVRFIRDTFHACSTKNESCRFRFSTIYFLFLRLRLFLDILYFLFRRDKVFELDTMSMMMMVVRFTFVILFLSLDQHWNVNEMVQKCRFTIIQGKTWTECGHWMRQLSSIKTRYCSILSTYKTIFLSLALLLLFYTSFFFLINGTILPLIISHNYGIVNKN